MQGQEPATCSVAIANTGWWYDHFGDWWKRNRHRSRNSTRCLWKLFKKTGVTRHEPGHIHRGQVWRPFNWVRWPDCCPSDAVPSTLTIFSHWMTVVIVLGSKFLLYHFGIKAVIILKYHGDTNWASVPNKRASVPVPLMVRWFSTAAEKLCYSSGNLASEKNGTNIYTLPMEVAFEIRNRGSCNF